MTYIRLSIAKPRHGQETRLADLMKQVAEAASSQPGCRESYLLEPHDDSGEVVRITLYEDEASADHAANDAHMMSLRSEINLASEAPHEERGFFSTAEFR